MSTQFDLNFSIRGDYRARAAASHFDDTPLRDEWQREVYLRAVELMSSEGLETVYDVGCGSGYKLITYLGKYKTIGFDVPQTIDFLIQKYPDRIWRYAPFSDRT